MNDSINYSSFISLPISIEKSAEHNEPSLKINVKDSEYQKPDFEQLQATIKNKDIEQWQGE